MAPKNKVELIPLFDLKVSAAARREVVATLKSGWLSSGPKVAAFEKAVAEHLKVKYAAAVASATAGLQLLLAAIGAGPRRQVITTPFTFVATIEAIMAAGAQPLLADIDPLTLNIDPDEVARKVSNRTAAVVPVDLAGYPADYSRLNKICDHFKLPLVSDSAHALCAAYRGKSLPHFVDAAVFSFYSTKNLTCGEGGMVVSRHQKVIEAIKLLANHGLTSNAYLRKSQGTWKYDAIGPGFKANMSDLAAAVGLGQLTCLNQEQERRGVLAERYRRNLAELDQYLELPIEQPGYRHGWHLFIIKLHLSRLRCDRAGFIRLMAARGVECGVHYQPVFELSWYRRTLGLQAKHFPNAVYSGQRVVSLPLYPTLKPAHLDYVCECVTDVVRRYGR